jgi:ribosomal protein S27E
MTFTALECTKCGGALQVSSAAEVVTCEYCNVTHLVEREGGSIQLIELQRRLDKLEDDQIRSSRSILALRLDKISEERVAMERLFDERRGKYFVRYFVGSVVVALPSVCIIAGSLFGPINAGDILLIAVIGTIIGIGIGASLYVNNILTPYRKMRDELDQREREIQKLLEADLQTANS